MKNFITKVWGLIKTLGNSFTQYHDYRNKNKTPYL